MHVSVVPEEAKRWPWLSLELELYVVVSLLMPVLGSKLSLLKKQYMAFISQPCLHALLSKKRKKKKNHIFKSFRLLSFLYRPHA